MPHLDVRFKESIVDGQTLAKAMQELTVIVGKHFNEVPEYVSVEILPQTKWTLNRKDVDLELSSSPDDEGERVRSAEALAQELGNWMQEYLCQMKINCEISAWVRVFTAGYYSYHARRE